MLTPPPATFSPLQTNGYFRPMQMTRPNVQVQAAIQPAEKPVLLRKLGLAAGMMTTGLLLHRLPASKTSFELVSSDWKEWARMGLGIASVNQLNQALQWRPQPWQQALEVVTALTALSKGILTKSGWRHYPLLAISVPLLVQGTHALNKWSERKLDETQSTLPRWIPRLAITTLSTVGGVFTLRGVLGSAWYGQVSGQTTGGKTAANKALTSGTLVCARCGGAHLVCMSEINDMVASIGSWFRPHPQKGLYFGKDSSHHEKTRENLSLIKTIALWFKEFVSGLITDMRLLLSGPSSHTH